MEVEKESLMKLKKLEAQLVDIIGKVDLEINQVDVEWLNLRSIALEKIQAEQKQNATVATVASKPTAEVKKSVSQVKMEFTDNDDFELMQLNLEVNPRVYQKLEEEFDSD